MKDGLGDRCKKYESLSERYFLPRIPVMVRVDGRAFHSWVKHENCEKPFDDNLISTMVCAARNVALNIPNCLGFYHQSDEVTFIIYSDSIESELWFGGRQNKIESIVASLMTAYFNLLWKTGFNQFATLAIFDARAFQCPLDDFPNVILWRAKDWKRNSIGMYCLNFFSHEELQGKCAADRLNMLERIQKSWEKDLTPRQRYGTYWNGRRCGHFEPTYDTIQHFFNETIC